MCWVMPPASPATTSASRTASSSEVLPWSTWPMIVTTGGRSIEVLGGVLELGLLVDVVRGMDDLDLLVELVGEHLDRVVGERLGERGHLAQLHQLLDHLGNRDGEVLRDVLDRRAGVDADRVGLEARLVLRHRLDVGATAPAAAAARRAALGAGRSAAGPALAARGLRVDDDAAHAAARAGGALTLQRGARGALGRGLGRVAVGRGLGLVTVGALGLLRLLLVELRATGQRAIRGVLVDRRGGGLDLDAGVREPLQHLG